jgi:hypothetical protein
MKELPFCAKCGQTRSVCEFDVRNKISSIHDFMPCVTLKDAEDYAERRVSIWNKQYVLVCRELKALRERDARLADKVRLLKSRFHAQLIPMTIKKEMSDEEQRIVDMNKLFCSYFKAVEEIEKELRGEK